MLCEIMNLLDTVGALIPWKTSQDHQNEIVSTLFGRQCDGPSCRSRECEIRRLRTHGGGLGEGGRPQKQCAGDSEEGSPNSTKVDSGDSLNSAGRKIKSGHNEALLLWNAYLTNGFRRSYSAPSRLFFWRHLRPSLVNKVR